MGMTWLSVDAKSGEIPSFWVIAQCSHGEHNCYEFIADGNGTLNSRFVQCLLFVSNSAWYATMTVGRSRQRLSL